MKNKIKNFRNREETQESYPDLNSGDIRVLIFGGIGEIGRNMYAIEYKNEVVVFDLGLKFGDKDTPGVKHIVCDCEYLKKKNVVGLIISSSSLKNFGGITHLMKNINSPKIFSRSMTNRLIKKRQLTFHREDHNTYEDIEKNEKIRISENITLNFLVHKNSSTSLSCLVETNNGCVLYLGKLFPKHKDGVIASGEEDFFNELKGKKIAVTLAPSLNSERLGFSLTDNDIAKSILSTISESKSRVVAPMFPNHIDRNSLVIEGATKQGRRIIIQGSYLFNSIVEAIENKTLNIPKEILIPIREFESVDEKNKSLILFEAEENETYPFLESICSGKNRYIKIEEDDVYLFPSPVIATNGRYTQKLKDGLSIEKGIIKTYKTPDTKASSCPEKDELSFILENIKTSYFLPIEGYHYMLNAHSKIAEGVGYEKSSCIVATKGEIYDISTTKGSIKMLRSKLNTSSISIDGRFPSPLQSVVIRDRELLGTSGIFIVIVIINQKDILLKKSPDIISRGFVYIRENQELIGQSRLVVKSCIEEYKNKGKSFDIDEIKISLQKTLQTFLIGETGKQPIIVPVIFT